MSRWGRPRTGSRRKQRTSWPLACGRGSSPKSNERGASPCRWRPPRSSPGLFPRQRPGFESGDQVEVLPARNQTFSPIRLFPSRISPESTIRLTLRLSKTWVVMSSSGSIRVRPAFRPVALYRCKHSVKTPGAGKNRRIRRIDRAPYPVSSFSSRSAARLGVSSASIFPAGSSQRWHPMTGLNW